jgi:hypothetical protein
MALELFTRSGQGAELSTLQIDTNWRRIKAAVDTLQAATSGGVGSVTDVSVSAIPTGFFANVTNPDTTPSIAITTNLNGFVKGNGSGFSAQANIVLTSDVSGVLPLGNGGTNAISFTASRVVVSNGGGTALASSAVTSTELGYVSGVTSAIQTQLNAKEATITTLPINKGGTGLGTTPNNGQILIGNGTNYTLANISAGAGISITNGSGTITIASTATSSQWVDSGNNIYFGNSTTGNVAIGTSSFVAGLNISKNGSSSGVGVLVTNIGANALDAAYTQVTNADNSQTVRLVAQGQGSTDNALVGTSSNTDFDIITNTIPRLRVANSYKIAVLGDNNSAYESTVDSKLTIFGDDLGSTDNLTLMTLIAPVYDATPSSAGIEFVGRAPATPTSSFGLARIRAYDMGGFSGDLAFETDLGTNDRSFAEHLRIKSAGNIGIGTTTPEATAKLQIASTTQGFLKPVMTSAQYAAIGSKAQGLEAFDATQQKPTYVAQSSGLVEWASSAIFTQTATTTISNSTSELTLFSTGRGSLTLPANFLTVGKTLKVRLIGWVNASSNPDLTLKLKYGATNISNDTHTMSSTDNNSMFTLDYLITCRTVGASGTVFAQGTVTYERTDDLHQILNAKTATVTIDTTASNTIDLTGQFSSASVNNNVNITNAIVEVIN